MNKLTDVEDSPGFYRIRPVTKVKETAASSEEQVVHKPIEQISKEEQEQVLNTAGEDRVHERLTELVRLGRISVSQVAKYYGEIMEATRKRD